VFLADAYGRAGDGPVGDRKGKGGGGGLFVRLYGSWAVGQYGNRCWVRCSASGVRSSALGLPMPGTGYRAPRTDRDAGCRIGSRGKAKSYLGFDLGPSAVRQ